MEFKSVRLPSGRFQVNFSFSDVYGYALAEPEDAVSEIVGKIFRHIEEMRDTNRYYQKNLYSMGSRNPQSGRIILFRRKEKVSPN